MNRMVLEYWKKQLGIPDEYREDLTQEAEMLQLSGQENPEMTAAMNIDMLYNKDMVSKVCSLLRECGYESN